MDIEMRIRGLMMDPNTNMPIVILKDVASEIVLPIWVGIYEANAIAVEIEKVQPPRPLTHDLLKKLMQSMNAQLEKIVITELKDDTFYSVLWMRQDGDWVTLDARPSDAIALALRMDCPIYVSKALLEQARLQAQSGEGSVGTEHLKRWLEGLNDEDMGKYKM